MWPSSQSLYYSSDKLPDLPNKVGNSIISKCAFFVTTLFYDSIVKNGFAAYVVNVGPFWMTVALFIITREPKFSAIKPSKLSSEVKYLKKILDIIGVQYNSTKKHRTH